MLGEALEAAEAGGALAGGGRDWLLAVTGCRLGEIVGRGDTIDGLKWREFDAPGRCLRLVDSKTGPSVRPLGSRPFGFWKPSGAVPGACRPSSMFLCCQVSTTGSCRSAAWGTARVAHGIASSAPNSRHTSYGTLLEASADGRLSELTIGASAGTPSARSGSTTRGYIAPVDDVLLAAADKVSAHIWAAMTGEPVSAGER